MNWFPRLPCGEGPRYLQIVAALHNDIATGLVAAGQQLPTQREMALKLNLSIGTVSKAYAAAERRGLISGQVGRGTFVLPAIPELGIGEPTAGEQRRVNLALNVPPATGEDRALGKVLAEIAGEDILTRLLDYLPHQGREEHRIVLAAWLSERLMPVSASGLYITHGAQHAISIAMRLLARPGAPILAENLTYSGMMALAQMESYALRGVAIDEHGLVPNALDQAFRETGSKVLYCTPTLQCATGAVAPVERRREIAEVVARHDGWIVEDDAYGFLPADPVPTLSSFLPDRSFYVVSFAKCLSPGLRIGALAAPPQFHDRVVNAIRSTGWMASAVMAEGVVRMMRDGTLDRQIALKRVAAAERTAIAQEILGPLLAPIQVPGFHVWLRTPAGRSATGLAAQAAQEGITLAAPSPLQPLAYHETGIRICLGGTTDLDDLRHALEVLSGILSGMDEMALL
jgi:DNA-binding transcriptional MocR family regulator